MVKKYNQQAKVQYSVPNAIDAVACCFMNFVNSGTRLFDSGPKGWTYTRCQELVEEKFPIVVGGFSPECVTIPANLIVDRNSYDSADFGVAALRQF